MKSIKPAPKTLIIAQVGVNHNANLDLAKQLIREAALARADTVKFQTFKAVHRIFSTSFQNSLTGSINPYGRQGASKMIIKNHSLKNIIQKKFYINTKK